MKKKIKKKISNKILVRGKILVKKNYTLWCGKKIQKKFFYFFFQNPEFWSAVKFWWKKITLYGVEKKYKKKLQNKDLLFFLNFFSSKPRILVRGKIPVKKKTPFVVTLGQPRIISYHMKKGA